MDIDKGEVYQIHHIRVVIRRTYPLKIKNTQTQECISIYFL